MRSISDSLGNETGTNYNYFRDYDPAVGRYFQSDPIGLEGGLSTFSYVADDPLDSVDPKGLDSGPYHQPDGVEIKCRPSDSCSQLRGKMWLFQRMIRSHEGWDRNNPPPRGGGRHATEIGQLWNGWARCQKIYQDKGCDGDNGPSGPSCSGNCQKTWKAVFDAASGAVILMLVCVALATS